MLVKVFGAVDIFSALIILFDIYHIHWIITMVHAAILVAKGGASLFSDASTIVMGLVDLVAALFIIFAIPGLLPIKIVLFSILMGKGAFSFA